MTTSGFHHEWITLKRHRILLECRASFPDARMRFAARLAVEIVGNRHQDAKVLSIYYDDKSSETLIRVASDNPSHKWLEQAIKKVFRGICPGWIFGCEVLIVEPGNKSSDRYDHADYLWAQSSRAIFESSLDDDGMSNVAFPNPTSQALLAKAMNAVLRNAQDNGEQPEHVVYQAMLAVRVAAQKACKDIGLDETHSEATRFTIPAPN